ncbi:PREDICTED: uncharacterized protein LOC104747675 [Camelina sativa]|uniref:Uncharacterized protein LOC104747675 n=1 Tax=Camelina sativa TaxID=90675 RepID=A0ABM0W9J5_CAMSA|nr:PREDICTED: uncharacterized protein LOC104747675 [Camelina sativa]
MKFLVEILSGSSFEIEVDYKDTLLEVKQKIEKSQRIPVSKQTLIVDGVVILREDLNVQQCQIVHDSLLQLDVSSDENPNDNGDDQIPQIEQPPEPWIPVEEYFEGQGWPLTSEEIKKIYSYRSETSQEINTNQMLHQTKQSELSDSVNETVNIQDSYVSKNSNNNNNNNSVVGQVPPTKQFLQSNSVKEITKIQNSPVKKRMVVFVSLYPGECKPGIVANVNPTDAVKKLREEIVQRGDIQKLHQDGYFFTHKKQVLNEDQSYEWNGVKDADTIVLVPRYVIQHISKIQDSTVRVQLPQTKQSPAAYLNVVVPKKKIKVVVLPSSDECKSAKNKIEVDVNLTDQVKILRNVLAESQSRGDLNLPQQGYYFARAQKVMNEEESFDSNGFTGPTDVVWMVPRRVTMQ